MCIRYSSANLYSSYIVVSQVTCSPESTSGPDQALSRRFVVVEPQGLLAGCGYTKKILTASGGFGGVIACVYSVQSHFALLYCVDTP